MSAATFLELSIVIDSRGDPVLSREIDELIQRFTIQIEPVTAEQARIARQAYRDYGKGSGHPANLNFGDCFSYALAREKREPILYKGDDFVHTDLRSALPDR
jgi:ribonuclease VapC